MTGSGYTTGSSSGYGSLVKYVETSSKMVEAEVYEPQTREAKVVNISEEVSVSNGNERTENESTDAIKPPDKLVVKDSMLKIKRPSKIV